MMIELMNRPSSKPRSPARKPVNLLQQS